MRDRGTSDNQHPAHLDEEEAVLYLAGEVSSSQRESIETHLSECDDCRIWLGSLARCTSREEGGLDRYIIDSQIGAGALGAVFLAWDVVLDRRVALKISRTGHASEREKSRMLDEARAMARISHAHVVSVLDAGILDNELFVVMEYIEGQTLDLWLQSRPAGKEILGILRQIAAGIQSVHAAGLVHRDIKPRNVIITRDNTAELLDFGLARPATMASQADHALDQAGTPAYMAPELLRGEPASPQSDIYAFCLLADEALRSPPHDRALKFLQAGRAADPGDRPASIEPFLAKEEEHPARRPIWLVATTVPVLALAALLYFTYFTFFASRDSGRSEACAVVEDAMERVWSRDVRTRIAEWSRSNEMLKQAVGRYTDQYGQAIQSLCAPGVGQQKDRAFGARIACLHGWVHQLEVTLATIEQIPEAFWFEALYELPSPRRCIKHENLPTTALIEPGDWKQGKQDRLALIEARKALLRSDTEKALALASEVSARDTRLPLQSLRAEAAEIRARASLIQRDFKQARIRYDEVIRIADADSDDRMRARAILGQLRVHTTHRKRPDEALALLRQYESLFESLGMPFWRGKFFYEYALAFSSLRQEEKALPWARKSLAVFRRILPGHHRDVLNAIHLTGQFMSVLGQQEEGERMHREGLKISIKHFGPRHAKVAAFELALAFDAQHQQKYAEAVKRYRRALGIYLQAQKRRLPSIAQARHMLCSALWSNKQYREAISICRKSVAENASVYGQHNPVMAYHRALLASALSEHGRHREAREILERALILAQARPDAVADTAFIRVELALVLKRLNRQHQREVSLVKQALQVLQPTKHPQLNERIKENWPGFAKAGSSADAGS